MYGIKRKYQRESTVYIYSFISILLHVCESMRKGKSQKHCFAHFFCEICTESQYLVWYRTYFLVAYMAESYTKPALISSSMLSGNRICEPKVLSTTLRNSSDCLLDW